MTWYLVDWFLRELIEQGFAARLFESLGSLDPVLLVIVSIR